MSTSGVCFWWKVNDWLQKEIRVKNLKSWQPPVTALLVSESKFRRCVISCRSLLLLMDFMQKVWLLYNGRVVIVALTVPTHDWIWNSHYVEFDEDCMIDYDCSFGLTYSKCMQYFTLFHITINLTKMNLYGLRVYYYLKLVSP